MGSFGCLDGFVFAFEGEVVEGNEDGEEVGDDADGVVFTEDKVG